MTAPLGEMLEHVLDGEPALADEVDVVFRRADELRRRRTRLLLAAGAVIVGLVVLAGYLLTTTLLPARGASRALPALTRQSAARPARARPPRSWPRQAEPPGRPDPSAASFRPVGGS